jgi:hypothetical protein
MNNLLRIICAILFITLNTSCNKITNINNDPNYAHLLNKEYLSLTDTLLYKPKGSSEYKIGLPGEYLPEIKDLKETPYYYENVIIYQVIPKNTVFKIVEILKEYRPMSGTYVHINAKIIDGNKYRIDIVNILFLTNFLDDHKTMDKKYLKEILSTGESTNAK